MSKLFLFSVLFSLLTVSCVHAGDGDIDISDAQYKKYLAAINKSGDTVPAKELKDVLLTITRNLDNPAIVAARKINRTLDLLLRNYEISLHQVNLKFTNHVGDYPYQIPYKKPLPIRYTLNVVEDGVDILRKVQAAVPEYKLDPKLVPGKNSKTWFDIIQNSTYNQFAKKLNLSGSTDLSNEAVNRATTFNDLVDKPAETYKKMHQRLVRYGENASFPEFAEPIDKLKEALADKDLKTACKNDKLLAALRDDLQRRLDYLQSPKGKNPTEVARMVKGAYPYRESVETIAKATQFFDIVERKKYAESTDYFKIERSWFEPKAEKLLPPPYHYDRYAYHWISLAEDPNVVMMPTNRELNFKNLVDSRVAPIEFLGVETKVVRADRYFNAPYDFWWHDINHSRRTSAYTENYLKKNAVKTLGGKYAEYQKMETESKALQKKISDLKLDGKYTKEQAAEIKKLMMVLLFEAEHETALNPDKASITKDILKKPYSSEPFEFMSGAQISSLELEKLRTGEGNLVSGTDVIKSKFTGNPIYVNYIRDRSLSMLSNVNNKLTCGFYDSVFDLNENELGKLQYRNPEYVAKAAAELLHVLSTGDVSHADLLKLAESRDGLEELYKAYYSVGDRMMLAHLIAEKKVDLTAKSVHLESEVKSANTTKMRTDQILKDRGSDQSVSVSSKDFAPVQNKLVPISTSSEEPKSMSYAKLLSKIEGKKVIVLGGYSGLGYENPEAVKDYIKSIIQAQGNDVVYVIGGTSDGIGEAYNWIPEIAKELNLKGVKTAGIVSKNALKYGLAKQDFTVLVDTPPDNWEVKKDGRSLMVKVAEDTNGKMIYFKGGAVSSAEIGEAIAHNVPVEVISDPKIAPNSQKVAKKLGSDPNLVVDGTEKFVQGGKVAVVTSTDQASKINAATLGAQAPLNSPPAAGKSQQGFTYEDLLAKTKGKKVVVLGGYSGLGYEDPEVVKAYIKSIMKAQGNDVVYVIGGTSDGIGAAYDWIPEIAKELNLKNIKSAGIVSKNALKYGLAKQDYTVLVDTAPDNWEVIQDGRSLMVKIAQDSHGKMIYFKGGDVSSAEIREAIAHDVPVEVISDSKIAPNVQKLAKKLASNPSLVTDGTEKFVQSGKVTVIASMQQASKANSPMTSSQSVANLGLDPVKYDETLSRIRKKLGGGNFCTK